MPFFDLHQDCLRFDREKTHRKTVIIQIFQTSEIPSKQPRARKWQTICKHKSVICQPCEWAGVRFTSGRKILTRYGHTWHHGATTTRQHLSSHPRSVTRDRFHRACRRRIIGRKTSTQTWPVVGGLQVRCFFASAQCCCCILYLLLQSHTHSLSLVWQHLSVSMTLVVSALGIEWRCLRWVWSETGTTVAC